MDTDSNIYDKNLESNLKRQPSNTVPDAAITAVTKCVNGGVIGLEDRKKHFHEYYNMLK